MPGPMGPLAPTSHIFGVDKQAPGCGQSDKEVFGPTHECRVRRAELITSPALLNLPRPSMAGAFSVHGIDEQIFGADNKSLNGAKRLRSEKALPAPMHS
jgi:hypothetical protein